MRRSRSTPRFERQRQELEILNARLGEQAAELELQTEEARATSEELEIANEELRVAAEDAESARTLAEESERRFRRTADAAPVLMWTTNAQREVEWLNRPWLEFTGRTLESELGHGWLEAVIRAIAMSSGRRTLGHSRLARV